MSEKRTAILILGMHRSGTSALTRVLNLCGVDLGSRLLPPAEGNNDSGFWEHSDAVDTHERLLFLLGRSWSDARALPQDWLESAAAAAALERLTKLIRDEFGQSRLWAVKDPRLCRFVPLWIKALDAAGVEVKLLYALRHPGEVIASLTRRDGLSEHENSLLLLTHFFEAALAGVGHARCAVTYQSLLDDWRGCTRRIARELDVDLSYGEVEAAQIEAFLDHGARNHHVVDDDVQLRESLNGRVYTLARDSQDSADFWTGVAGLGDYWDLYRRDLLPYIDELLDMLAVRDALERQARGPAPVVRSGHDRNMSPLIRLQFRMIAGLQDGIGRLGQASADLGAMVRIGSEGALGAASQIAGTVEALRDGVGQIQAGSQGARDWAMSLQQQVGEVLVQADLLRRHMDELARRSDERLNLFAADGERRLQECTAAQTQAASVSEAVQQRLDGLARSLEELAARERQRDEMRWPRRLRRLLSGK